jgi:ankyrin repeat protein
MESNYYNLTNHNYLNLPLLSYDPEIISNVLKIDVRQLFASFHELYPNSSWPDQNQFFIITNREEFNRKIREIFYRGFFMPLELPKVELVREPPSVSSDKKKRKRECDDSSEMIDDSGERVKEPPKKLLKLSSENGNIVEIFNRLFDPSLNPGQEDSERDKTENSIQQIIVSETEMSFPENQELARECRAALRNDNYHYLNLKFAEEPKVLLYSDENNSNLLHAACMGRRSTERLDYLLSLRIFGEWQMNARDRRNDTPLDTAYYYGHVSLVNILLPLTDIRQFDSNNNTTLHKAIYREDDKSNEDMFTRFLNKISFEDFLKINDRRSLWDRALEVEREDYEVVGTSLYKNILRTYLEKNLSPYFDKENPKAFESKEIENLVNKLLENLRSNAQGRDLLKSINLS